MNGMTIAGVVVMLLGALITSDYKGLGLSSPAVGILVGGAGFFLAAYGFFSGEQEANRGGGRKVRDNSV